MTTRLLCALACAISGCMSVHEVPLGADVPRMMVADAGATGEPESADAAVGLPESPDAGARDTGLAPDAMADAARGDASFRDATSDSSGANAAPADAGGQVHSADGGDAGKPHDDDHLP